MDFLFIQIVYVYNNNNNLKNTYYDKFYKF